MLNISSENNGMFTIFEIKHLNFSFQGVLLGENKWFYPKSLLKKSLLKNKEQMFLLNWS